MGETLLPAGRYAHMGNVWFLPSCDTLLSWLRKLGFVDAQLVDVRVTTTAEQRTTEWMTFHSLANFPDPDDASKTIEGYPAPRRAIVTAWLPGVWARNPWLVSNSTHQQPARLRPPVILRFASRGRL